MKTLKRPRFDDAGVSPVIAVILMVAITVVLAASVFVLVNDLGKNVGSAGPTLGLVSDSAHSSTTQWTMKVTSATKSDKISDFRFVLSTPGHGAVVARPDPASGTFTAAYTMNATWNSASLPPDRLDAAEAGSQAQPNDDWVGYWLSWTDVDGSTNYGVGDTLVVTYDADNDNAAYDDAFASGTYTLEILHTPSGSSAALLPRTF